MDSYEFIEAIGNAVRAIAPNYGIRVYSPVIAQACLESAYGTSHKASHHNYFGLKYRENRVSCNCGFFNDDSQEQNDDGTYNDINTMWYSFDTLEDGVEGYFQFISTDRYANLKDATSPREYLEYIKDDGYATSIDYVDNLMRVIEENDLTRFDDEIEVKHMDNSLIQIDENIVSEDMYGIKCPYEMDAIGVTIHQTGNTGNSSADNEIAYMISNSNEVSYHFAVDEEHAVQGLPLNRNGWHAGDGNGDGNRHTIGIEICRDYSPDREQYDKAVDNGARLAATILKEYGWDIDHLYKHEDWSGKHCPAIILNEGKWDWFKAKVQSYLDGGDGTVEDTDDGRSWSYEQARDVTEALYKGLLYRGFNTGNGDGDSENEYVMHGLQYDMTRIEAFDSIRASEEHAKKSLIVDCYLVMRGSIPSEDEINGWMEQSDDDIKHGILYSDEFNGNYNV